MEREGDREREQWIEEEIEGGDKEEREREVGGCVDEIIKAEGRARGSGYA